MAPLMVDQIESKLREKWSPEQISGWLLEEKEQLLSYETIYLHIWDDKNSGGDLYRYLRRKEKNIRLEAKTGGSGIHKEPCKY